jgi:hypothetical protein
MSQTFLFEELDPESRAYLLAVRERQGKKSPGMFAPLSNPWPGIGIVVGPLIILFTLLFTLTTWINVVYDDPNRVALLQSGGLLLGGWMTVAAVRVWVKRRGTKYAGHWAYADSLHLYHATGDLLTVTPIDDAHGAKYTHKYNNDSYQHSLVFVKLSGKQTYRLKVSEERRAEQLVAFVNYLAWARGPDGGTRGDLDPTQLGGLARYVVKNETEPLDGDGNFNLDLFEVTVGDVPEEPRREGRAFPNVIPYAVIFLAALLCFFVMGLVDVGFRDDAIYEAVTRNPEEPRFLRAYLIDPRNTRHRDDVTNRLPKFYNRVVESVRANGGDPTLKDGFAQVLDSLRKAGQPVVSIRMSEMKAPAGGGDAAERTKKLQEGIVDRINAEFGRIEPAVQPPPDTVFTVQPPPIGHQLIAFAEMPEDAPNPHFDIGYAFHPDPDKAGLFQVAVRVTIRVKVEDAPVATKDLTLPKSYTAEQTDQALTDLREQIGRDMVGSAAAVGFPAPGVPQFPQIVVP